MKAGAFKKMTHTTAQRLQQMKNTVHKRNGEGNWVATSSQIITSKQTAKVGEKAPLSCDRL